MFSRYRRIRRLLCAAALGGGWVMLSAWTHNPTSGYLPGAQAAPPSVAVSGIFPGGGAPPPMDPLVKKYEGNPYYIEEGHRLFLWYNCVGCHSNGGGGMGPPFINAHWHFGGRLDQIFASIYQGRPKGMPYWGGKIPDGQIWELAAFVKSLSSGSPQTPGPVPKPPAGPVKVSHSAGKPG